MASFAGKLPLFLALFLVEKAEGKVKLIFNFSSRVNLEWSISLTCFFSLTLKENLFD